MKILSNIKKHHQLRIEQELICHNLCAWTQINFQNRQMKDNPYIDELSLKNIEVSKIANEIPNLYFILSDLFGGAYLLRKKVKKTIKEKGLNVPH